MVTFRGHFFLVSQYHHFILKSACAGVGTAQQVPFRGLKWVTVIVDLNGRRQRLHTEVRTNNKTRYFHPGPGVCEWVELEDGSP